MLVRIVIVTNTAGDMLRRCLKALLIQSRADFEVVVVDNGCTDGNAETTIPKDERFSLVRPEGNIGFGAGNNLGAAGATTPWIATLNPDAYPAPDWWERMAAAITRFPDAAMLGCVQVDANDQTVIDGIGDHWFPVGLGWRSWSGQRRPRPEGFGETFSPCAAAAFYRRDVFERVSGFDEKFFCYLEDIDLGFRLRLIGEWCLQVPDAVVEHEGSGLNKRDSDFVRYHTARNRIWMFVKDTPGPLFWLLIPWHILLVLLLLARAASRGRLSIEMKGVRDGVRDMPRVWRQRRAIQASRRISWIRAAGALTWNPLTALRRGSDLRPVHNPEKG
jgi:N-acetylglucosaminyl-diphospho-decaprenol L-rhamnosyltransferase